MSNTRYLAALHCLLIVSLLAPFVNGDPVDFNKDIRPILADRCFHCHGPDTTKNKADLRLDLEDRAKDFAISPGDVEDSDLITRILSADPEEHMPPPDSGKKRLTADEAALLTTWIEEGAVWDTHWAWSAPKRIHPEPAAGGRNTIDHIVFARLDDEGLAPSNEASKETLIRRASFDLIGLPPTLDEVDAFLKDKSNKAYERVLDRLLASPRYGERMAIDWLDGARYADSNGFQNDFGRDMHPWRDWVIKAFNDNMPFDQFTVEQIAGDLLPNATDDQRIATGFNRNHRANTEGGSIEEEWRIENIIDRVETTGAMFLGLTLGCARCHDHKYDPITQKDFYRFFAFFNSTKERGFYEETRGNTGPQVSLATEVTTKRIAEYDADIAEAEEVLRGAVKVVGARDSRWRRNLTSGKFSIPSLKPSVHLPLQGSLSPLKDDAGHNTQWETGVIGESLALSGGDDSYVDLASAYSFERESAFTVTVWVRPETAGAIFSKAGDVDSTLTVDLQILGDRKLQVNLVQPDSDEAIRIRTNARIPFNEWTHVAMTDDGSEIGKGVSVYVNGVKVKIVSEVYKPEESESENHSLMLGRLVGSAFLKGRLTDFRIYDTALSPDGVSGLMRGTLSALLPETLSDSDKTAIEKLKESRRTLSVVEEQGKVDKINRGRTEYVKRNVTTVMVLEEMDTPRETYRLVRGMYDAPDETEALSPEIPSFLPPMTSDMPRNRLGLAQWLVSAENPLTARVTVNRLWQKMFGDGLVRTAENFGTQSEVPEYPELLDWLATEFVALDWDLKAIQKTIMISATYRQGSASTQELLAHDPENILYARGPRFRMQSELVRDNALAVSGLLSSKIGGPAVKPYQPAGMWEELAGGASQGPYKADTGESLYRRSLYTFRKRTVPHATMSTFDAPSFEVCYVRRGRTNTPLQALALLNDTTYVEAARHLAERMIDEGGKSPKKRIAHGFRLATGRYPSERELSVLERGYSGYEAMYVKNPEQSQQYISHGDSKPNGKIDAGKLAAYSTVASVILNLDETITKE